MIDNRATLARQQIIDHSGCEECEEEYLFLLKDKYHEFSIGLTDVLACLAFAQHQGAVPALPDEWWVKINNRYA